MTRVAVDAMGGDHAPDAIVAGAVEAHRADGVQVLLCGDPARIASALEAVDASPGPGIEICGAAGVIPMDDPDPARAVRSQPDSSIAVAADLVKQGRADAVFSAGPTGAALAAAVLRMGRIRGVKRPAITTVLPFPGAPTVLVDTGANADVRPEQLVDFALLGSVFAQVRLGVHAPRVGLLSNGEEAGKGNELVKAAFPLLQAAPITFLGNVEGRDVVSADVDVVVTDGFTGNVVLKVLEGFSRFLMQKLLEVFTASDEAKAASEVLMPGLLELAAEMSPETHGGAQLLGVEGVCIIGHGSSSAQAVRAALSVAARDVEADLVGRVTERIRGGGPQTLEDM